MIYTSILFAMLCLAFLAQEFIPDIEVAFRAKLLVVPAVFFSGALTVSYPTMLALAFFTGFIWDARHLAPGGLGSEMMAGDLAFGYSIFLYGVLGSFMQGISPLFSQGRWELPVLMTGIATLFLLTFEYLLINFMRGGFYFPSEVWMKIITTSLFTTFAAPVLFLLLYKIARISGYRIRYEGLSIH